MVKPINIVDEWGVTYLGCPNCAEPIYSPWIKNPIYIYGKRPSKCVNCGKRFDWSGYDEEQVFESAGVYADNPTLREA